MLYTREEMMGQWRKAEFNTGRLGAVALYEEFCLKI